MGDLFTFRPTDTRQPPLPPPSFRLQCLIWKQMVLLLTHSQNLCLKHLAAVIQCDARSMLLCVVGQGCFPPQHLLIRSDFKSWIFLAVRSDYHPILSLSLPWTAGQGQDLPPLAVWRLLCYLLLLQREHLANIKFRYCAVDLCILSRCVQTATESYPISPWC